MKEKPLVSILTPSYNMSSYITFCIESVLVQDYDRVEHIIQDGASTDGTLEILKRYTDRIDWVSESDRGQSDALNKALQRCKGDIILVLNADDELLPHACSWGVEQMQRHPDAAVVYGDQHIIDSEGAIIVRYRGPDPYDFEKIVCVEDVIPAQAAFIRRHYLEKVGFYVDVTRRTCPDYEMWVRIGQRFPMKHVDGFVARYRAHSGSEGCQSMAVSEMVKSKSQVMNRLFSDSSTPRGIKKLRWRARSGVLLWAVPYWIRQRMRRRAVVTSAQAILMYPSRRRIQRVLKMFFMGQRGGDCVKKNP